MGTSSKLAAVVLLILSFILLAPADSSAITKAQKRKARSSLGTVKRGDMKQAEARLSEMGYGHLFLPKTGRQPINNNGRRARFCDSYSLMLARPG